MKSTQSFVLTLAAVCLVGSVFATESMAQGRRGGGRGGFDAGSNMGFLLMNQGVQKELDLTDSQVRDLEDLQQEMRDGMREMFREMRDMDAEERSSRMKEINEDMEAELKGILVDHQFSRLRQISVQSSMRGGNAEGLLRNSAVVEELGLTDEDIEKLKEKNEEVQEELNKKIARLREQAQKEIFSVLSSEKREKLEDMIGDKFEMQWGRGRGQQRGAQQRGGRGRGGRDDG